MKDIFGEALKGYLNGNPQYYLIRRKDGNSCRIDTCEYFSDYQDWNNCEKETIMAHVQGRVLDIGAGAGRHSLFLKKRNLEVHSLDISPFAVNLMKMRGLKNVYLMDLRKMDFPDNYFDSVLMISNDLGLAGTIKDTKELLKTLFRIVKPDGKVIATIRDSNKSAADSRESLYSNQERKLAKMVNKIRLRMEYNNAAGDWFYALLASKEELGKLIKGTGWFISNIIEKEGSNLYGAVLKKENDYPVNSEVKNI